MKSRLCKITIMSFFACMAALPSLAAGEEENNISTYIIGQGDVLSISVWKDEALTREVVVLPDGMVSFPLVGNLAAEGKTIDGLKANIVEKLKRFVPDPEISVMVKNPASLYIYVIGRVNNPGRFVLNSTVNVLQALATAGGLNPFAENNNIKIFRSDNGQTRILPFRYNDVVKGEKLEQNILLKRGDVVVVP